MKKVATMKALWALTSQLDAISYGVDAVSEIHKKEEKFDKKKDRLVTAGIVLFSALAVAQVFNLCCKIAKIGNSNSKVEHLELIED